MHSTKAPTTLARLWPASAWCASHVNIRTFNFPCPPEEGVHIEQEGVDIEQEGVHIEQEGVHIEQELPVL